MPVGQNGERRPADLVGCAVMVARIATGEIEDSPKPKSGRVRSGKAGGAARAESLTKKERTDIAKKCEELAIYVVEYKANMVKKFLQAKNSTPVASFNSSAEFNAWLDSLEKK